MFFLRDHLKRYRSLICSTNAYAPHMEPRSFDYLNYDWIEHVMHVGIFSFSLTQAILSHVR